MAKADFAGARKQAEEAGMLGGGDIYKYKEGDNRFRLMSMCLPHVSEYQGQRNFKWLCYVLDRRDNKVKVHFMPHTIYKAIEALQENPDYMFAEVPMPYDLTVRAKGAGTKDVEYSVIPARHEVPLSPAEEAEINRQKSLEDVQKALKEKQPKKAAAPVPPADSADPPPLTDDDIPF